MPGITRRDNAHCSKPSSALGRPSPLRHSFGPPTSRGQQLGSAAVHESHPNPQTTHLAMLAAAASRVPAFFGLAQGPKDRGTNVFPVTSATTFCSSIAASNVAPLSASKEVATRSRQVMPVYLAPRDAVATATSIGTLRPLTGPTSIQQALSLQTPAVDGGSRIMHSGPEHAPSPLLAPLDYARPSAAPSWPKPDCISQKSKPPGQLPTALTPVPDACRAPLHATTPVNFRPVITPLNNLALPPLPPIEDAACARAITNLVFDRTITPNVQELALLGDSVASMALVQRVQSIRRDPHNGRQTVSPDQESIDQQMLISKLKRNSLYSYISLAYQLIPPAAHRQHSQKHHADLFEAYIGALSRERHPGLARLLCAIFSPDVLPALRDWRDGVGASPASTPKVNNKTQSQGGKKGASKIRKAEQRLESGKTHHGSMSCGSIYTDPARARASAPSPEHRPRSSDRRPQKPLVAYESDDDVTVMDAPDIVPVRSRALTPECRAFLTDVDQSR